MWVIVVNMLPFALFTLQSLILFTHFAFPTIVVFFSLSSVSYLLLLECVCVFLHHFKYVCPLLPYTVIIVNELRAVRFNRIVNVYAWCLVFITIDKLHFCFIYYYIQWKCDTDAILAGLFLFLLCGLFSVLCLSNVWKWAVFFVGFFLSSHCNH